MLKTLQNLQSCNDYLKLHDFLTLFADIYSSVWVLLLSSCLARWQAKQSLHVLAIIIWLRHWTENCNNCVVFQLSSGIEHGKFEKRSSSLALGSANDKQRDFEDLCILITLIPHLALRRLCIANKRYPLFPDLIAPHETLFGTNNLNDLNDTWKEQGF